MHTHAHTYTYTNVFITLCLLALYIYIHTQTHTYIHKYVDHLCLLALYVYIHTQTHIYTQIRRSPSVYWRCAILGDFSVAEIAASMTYLRDLTGKTNDQLKALTSLDLRGAHFALPTTNTALSLTYYPSTQQQRSPVRSNPHAYRMLTILSTLTRTRTKTFNPSQNTNSDFNTHTHRHHHPSPLLTPPLHPSTLGDTDYNDCSDATHNHTPPPGAPMPKQCVWFNFPSAFLSTLTATLTIMNTLNILT